MSTALDIITRAMQKAGILMKNEAPQADESADALESLNDLLSSWSNESLSIYVRAWENFTLSGGTETYTIGSGQTFNTTRPLHINEAHIRLGSTDIPLRIVSDEAYNQIDYKAAQGVPELLNYDNGYPYGQIRLYPVPSSALSLYLLSEKALSSFALSDTVNLPPGWRRALIYNLAVELAPEYGQRINPETFRIAKEAKAAIQRAVSRARTFDVKPGRAKTNILTDNA